MDGYRRLELIFGSRRLPRVLDGLDTSVWMEWRTVKGESPRQSREDMNDTREEPYEFGVCRRNGEVKEVSTEFIVV